MALLIGLPKKDRIPRKVTGAISEIRGNFFINVQLF